MILKFCFSQVQNNGILENLLQTILHKIIHKINVKYVIEGFEKEVNLYVKADEEMLKTFGDEFSKLLPISLFYTFLKTEVVSDMPKQKSLKSCDINLPFTHTMLLDFLDKKSSNYLNTALKEDVGKSLHVKKSFTLKEIDEKIKLLKDDKILHVNTRFGKKSVGLINEKTKHFLSHSFTVMPCDLSLVQKMVAITQNELQALASLEKPTLNLRVNLIYKNKNILPDNWVNMRMFDSLLLYLLCKRLFDSGEEFIFLCDDLLPCDGELVSEQKYTAKNLHVNILENNTVTMLGENDYTSKQEIPVFEQKAHERFTALLYEYNLFDKKNLSYFLSIKNDDFAMFYSEKFGLIELIHVEIPASFKELIENIQKGENGKKLISNYQKQYGEILNNALNIEIPKDSPKNFFTLLGIAGVLLGFGEDIKNAAYKLLLHAKDFLGAKSVRIDVKTKKDKFPTTINVEKFIQSGLSFKLANVENQTLSYGYMESIGFFVSDMTDVIAKEFEVQNVSMCGDLFGFKRLLENSAKNILPNHKVYINKAFSLE